MIDDVSNEMFNYNLTSIAVVLSTYTIHRKLRLLYRFRKFQIAKGDKKQHVFNIIFWFNHNKLQDTCKYDK